MDGRAEKGRMDPRSDRLRIGDAERDAMSSALQEHFALGRLTRDELDDRLTAAMSARTVADLRALSADLPEPLALPEPAGPPAPRGLPGPPGSPVRGAWGGSWRGVHSDLAYRSWHPLAYGVHRRPPRAAPVIGALLVVTFVVTGPAHLAPALRPLLVVWLLLAVAAFHARRRWRRRAGR